MDYIIFGIGAGSSLVLIGWLLRDWGPALRDRKSRGDTEQVLTAQQMVDQMRWARFCGSCGTALAIGGAFVLLLTIIAMFVNPTDDRGAMIVLTTFGVVSVAMLIWSWLFVRRFGVAGIVRRKPESAPRRGFRSMVPKNPFASRTVEQVTQEPPIASEPSPAEIQPEPIVSAQPEPALSIEDDQASVQEITNVDEVAANVDTPASTDEEAPAEAPVAAADDVGSLEDSAVVEEPAVEPDEVAESTVEESGDDHDADVPTAQPGDGTDETDSKPDADQAGADEEPGSEATETVSSREEALRNLRQRRLGRLTHDPS